MHFENIIIEEIPTIKCLIIIVTLEFDIIDVGGMVVELYL